MTQHHSTATHPNTTTIHTTPPPHTIPHQTTSSLTLWLTLEQVGGPEPCWPWSGKLAPLLPCMFKAISSVLQVFAGDLNAWCVLVIGGGGNGKHMRSMRGVVDKLEISRKSAKKLPPHSSRICSALLVKLALFWHWIHWKELKASPDPP